MNERSQTEIQTNDARRVRIEFRDDEVLKTPLVRC